MGILKGRGFHPHMRNSLETVILGISPRPPFLTIWQDPLRGCRNRGPNRVPKWVKIGHFTMVPKWGLIVIVMDLRLK